MPFEVSLFFVDEYSLSLLFNLFLTILFLGLQDIKTVKDEPAPSSKSSAPTKGATPSKSGPATRPSPATEDEIRAVLLEKGPVTTQELVAKFRSRLKCKEVRDSACMIYLCPSDLFLHCIFFSFLSLKVLSIRSTLWRV